MIRTDEHGAELLLFSRSAVVLKKHILVHRFRVLENEYLFGDILYENYKKVCDKITKKIKSLF